MSFRNVLRQVKNIIYRLKRQYGLPITLRQPVTNSYDLETGEVTKTYNDLTIKRAILPPTKFTRDFEYDLSFIAANKNFTYGGFFGSNVRLCIIDADDLTSGYEPDLSYLVVFETELYTIKAVHKAEHGQVYTFVIEGLETTDEVS